MKVIVTGATGFTGSYVVPKLIRQGAKIKCLVRRTSDTSSLPSGVDLIRGDLDELPTIQKAFQGNELLVNIASLGFGHAPNIVEAAIRGGIRRALFVSTTAIFTSLNAPSKAIRTEAERVIRNSGLPSAILRPTMIFGSSRDRNMCRLIRFLLRYPLIPILGDGQRLQQPVYVDDLAFAVVQSLATPGTIGKSYNISGKEPLTYNQMIDVVCNELGRKVRRVCLPARLVVGVLSALERLPLSLPLRAEQVLRLNEDKVFDYSDANRDFSYCPRTFRDAIRLEIEEMGLKLHEPLAA